MLVGKAASKRIRFTTGRMLAEFGLGLDRWGSRLSGDIAHLQPYSRHRKIMGLYDRVPEIINSFIAPNASVVGECYIQRGSSIWYNVSVRGDHAPVRIGQNVNIGDFSVLSTAGSLPTGIPESVNIGNNVTIQPRCNLYACTIDDSVIIGMRSTVLEGAVLERGAVIGPNSVVPPGRRIPANQYWAGSPVEYVSDVTPETRNEYLADSTMTSVQIEELEEN
mmetsp:Transcript_8957/g.9690  ORF Transcript_8957/g.9690 Transcript_8957/m.9690 type:complete len:221 (+) Transcript_8957:2-664(+)